MDGVEDRVVRENGDHLNFVAGMVESNKVVFDGVCAIRLFNDDVSIFDSVDDVFTGQAVLERGSANSDVIEG